MSSLFLLFNLIFESSAALAFSAQQNADSNVKTSGAIKLSVKKNALDEFVFLNAVTINFIQPKHRVFEQAVTSVDEKVNAFCSEKNQSNWLALRASWSVAMNAWMQLHLVNYGPIDDSNLAWRFQFWPDPMNLVARKLKSRVKGRNKKISPEHMAKASVAIQGLSALEYLLFDEQLLEEDSFNEYKEKSHLCALAQSTVSNLLVNANRLTRDWFGQFKERWLNQEVLAGNPNYFEYNIEKVFSGMTMAVGMSYRDRIGKAIGIKKGEGEESINAYPNPFLLESWRSRQSLENIRNTLVSVSDLYRLKGSFSDVLVSLKTDEAVNLDIQIKKQLDRSLSLLSDHKVNAYDAIHAGDTEVLFMLYDSLKGIHFNLKNRYTKLVGIQFRFNAHDGD